MRVCFCAEKGEENTLLFHGSFSSKSLFNITQNFDVEIVISGFLSLEMLQSNQRVGGSEWDFAVMHLHGTPSRLGVVDHWLHEATE
jgi:hypothetical protein